MSWAVDRSKSSGSEQIGGVRLAGVFLNRFDVYPILEGDNGLPGLRPMPKEIMNEILGGRSAVVMLPTASGESHSYHYAV